MRRWGLVRGAGAASYLWIFALSGIATVLATRFFLAQAGYPKLGGGGSGRLHIAHMLWGGLLMMAGLVLLLALLGRTVRLGGAVVGGVGFGLFIDEVGKQVTDEPGYFYQPAAGIIYLAFALLLVLAHRTRRAPHVLAPEQRTAQAADLLLSGVTDGLTPGQRATVLRLVDGSDRDLDAALVRLLRAVPERAEPEPSALRRLLSRALGSLRRLAVNRFVLALAVLWLMLEVFVYALALTIDVTDGELARDPQWGAVIGVMISATASAVFGLRGLARLRRDKVAGLRLLRRALLVDVLFGQIFKFTVNQFAAVTELAFDLVLLWVISAALAQRDPEPVAPSAT
ncbi:hypothetical protein [Streptomyces sp. NBC_01304]|uniref:hypothetical protein n=1 Tax=Streptomyces sp. NBC_01304 TaxID=2903818 RepID=UPI002E0DAE09|nr:hypothetical protein OG430_21335 [Streptomyces sp. NBC_01304]